MTTFDRPPRHRSYLLTFWEERNQDTPLPVAWRFRLEDPRTGRQRGFATLEALTAALGQEMGGQQASNAEAGDWSHSKPTTCSPVR